MSSRDLETRLGEWGRREYADAERLYNPTTADPFARAASQIARRNLVVRTAIITTLIVLLLGIAGWQLADAVSTGSNQTESAER